MVSALVNLNSTPPDPQDLLAQTDRLRGLIRRLVLDEATAGLAPLIRQEIWRRLEQLKQSGLTILLIDKNIDEFAHIADRHFIVEKGRVVWQGSSDELTSDAELKARYLGI